MTVIVAARTKDDTIVMAADRAVSQGWTEHTHEVPKIWAQSDWIAGGTGTMRGIQVVKHWLTYPRYRPDEDTDWEGFGVKTLVPAIRTAVTNSGTVRTNDGVEHMSGSLLLAVKGRLVEVGTDYSIFSDVTGRAAVGSGYMQALGFLGDSGPWTEDDVVEAVARACQTARGVALPIDVTDTKTLKVRPAKVRAARSMSS